MTKDEIAQKQSDYAEAWTKAIIDKREADLWRRCEQPLAYYIHDGIRRILSDLNIEDPQKAKEDNR